MYSRPSSSETDEDLIRMHEEFIKVKNEKKIQLAAKVIREYNKDPESSQALREEATSIREQISNTFEDVPRSDGIGKIIEKGSSGATGLPQIKYNKDRGFPQARRRDIDIDSSERTGSIFSRHFKRMKREQIPVESMDVDLTKPTTFSIKERTQTSLSEEPKPNQSYFPAGPESASIHEENLNKLKTMSEREILEEKEKLISTLDPAIVAFLKSRRPKMEPDNRNRTIKEQNEAAQNVDLEMLEAPREILNKPESENWLNFGAFESNKLAWMQGVDIPKVNKSESFEARFDFDGWLMPFSHPDITEHSRILYHHGEEPGRPGYTLQELLQLSRSNVIQQKIVALNSIANILSLQSTGVYDDVIDLPIEQIFFVLRYCLDDNTATILNASIKAMRNLFYSKVDETCLDALLGFGLGQIQPTLGVDDVIEDNNTENDQELAEKNLVRCLTRTEILTRIRYVINTVKPSIETVVYCMDILTRLARDSRFVMMKVYESEDLIKSIFDHFVPPTPKASNRQSPYGLPLLQALKLLRVLASRGRQISLDLISKYNLMESLSVYISSESYALNINGLRLQTESVHLWCVLIHYNLALDWFSNLSPVILRILDYHFKNTHIDAETTFVRQGHMGAVLKLIGIVAEKQPSLLIDFSKLLQDCFGKFMKQFMNSSQFSESGKLQIISACFFCMSCAKDSVTNTLEGLVSELLRSKSFEKSTETIKNGSMLLNNYGTHKTSANLKSVEAAAWHTSEHVVPIMQSNSCLLFLSALSNFIQNSDNLQLKLDFLHQNNISKYVKDLASSKRFYMGDNWFTRVENRLIMNILNIAITMRKDDETSAIYYELAVKSLPVFSHDQKLQIQFILNRIVFSSEFYPSETLFQNLSIDQRTECLETSLLNLEEISTVYTKVLGLDNKIIDYRSSVCLDVGLGNVIPIDWIYTPIIVLYSNRQEHTKTLSEEDQVFIIRNCLRWVLIYDTYFPDLSASINPTDRFCRIACVFLGSDSLFLITEIHNLLELCLINVMRKFEGEIDFDKEIQGLMSFQDLYTELLEQYQSVSYGDVLFGNFMLVPLAQRHNIKFRKTLWSEYMGVVEIFNVTPQQSICALETFLEPPEQDLSLLKCYRRALVNNSIRRHSILYQIAKHHVENFISNKKSK